MAEVHSPEENKEFLYQIFVQNCMKKHRLACSYFRIKKLGTFYSEILK